MGAHQIAISMNESRNNYGHAIFSMSKSLYSELEQNARALLNDLKEQGGPLIYTLTPEKARDPAPIGAIEQASQMLKLVLST
jgi:hypothetical protein